MRVVFTIIFGYWLGLAFGQQPPICGNNPAMTSFCAQACIICDIDGFTGRNNSSIKGQAPPDFCTSYVHHMQWIGFIAGTSTLTLEVKVSNCARNNGLEIGLYESLDCQTFRRISDCDTDIQPGETRVFKNTVPLTIGQYYYFVMDGSDDDICDWTIKVTEGSTKVAPLEIAPEITFPDEICQNEVFEMTTPGLVGATFYNWSIDGSPFKSGTSVNHSLGVPGNYKVCLDASNVCDQAPQASKNIKVLPVPRDTIHQELCFGQCFTYLGKEYCQSGMFDNVLQASNGCDSVVTLALAIKDQIISTSDIKICEGDTISIGNGKFYTAGKHELIIKNQEGCDIYMTLNINVIVCNILSETEMTPVVCNGEKTGSLKFKIDAGTPPFTYSGYKVENSSVTFSGNISDITDWTTISGLDEGNYTIIINDLHGNSKVINQFVAQPSKLGLDYTVALYNGFGVRCFGAEDGSITWNPSGGTPPYSIDHAFTSQGDYMITSLAAGTYHTTITDTNGCITEVTAVITSPEKLIVQTEKANPDCSGPETGSLSLSAVSGGVAPYTYTLDNRAWPGVEPKKGLKEGIYTLVTKDKNGCIVVTTDTLIAAIIPTLDINTNLQTINLGDSITLSAFCSVEDVQIQWTPAEFIACSTCLTTKAQPISDQKYTLVVISKDGCETSATTEVRVTKNRSFVISDIITPDGNGINDKIRYLAGNDVSKLEYIKIYDRWGNLVYISENIPASGVTDLDWNADFHGLPLQNGVFTLIASVSYIDNEVILYKGSLTILR